MSQTFGGQINREPNPYLSSMTNECLTKPMSPVDGLLDELSATIMTAREEVQGLVNQLEPVRQMAPREKKDQAREVGACQTEEKLLEAIAGLRGMIEGVRATKAELRVW